MTNPEPRDLHDDRQTHIDGHLNVYAEVAPGNPLTDPVVHLQLEVLRHALARADHAMRAEGIEPAARDRVICTVLFGVPYRPGAEELRRRAELERQQAAPHRQAQPDPISADAYADLTGHRAG